MRCAFCLVLTAGRVLKQCPSRRYGIAQTRVLCVIFAMRYSKRLMKPAFEYIKCNAMMLAIKVCVDAVRITDSPTSYIICGLNVPSWAWHNQFFWNWMSLINGPVIKYTYIIADYHISSWYLCEQVAFLQYFTRYWEHQSINYIQSIINISCIYIYIHTSE